MAHEHFGPKDTIIQGDNIIKSKQRYEAIERVRRGQGTVADHELVQATDRVMAEAMKGRK